MSLQESLRLSQAESQGRAEKIASLENDVSELEAKARAHETERRRLHNTIQELKVSTAIYVVLILETTLSDMKILMCVCPTYKVFCVWCSAVRYY